MLAWNSNVCAMRRPLALLLPLALLCLALLSSPCAADLVESLPCVGGWLPALAQLTDDGGAFVVSTGRSPRLYRVDSHGSTLRSLPLYYYASTSQLLLTSDRSGVWLKTGYNISTNTVFGTRQAVYLYDSSSLALLANVSAPLFSPSPPTGEEASWPLALDSKDALYVAIPSSYNTSVHVFEGQGEQTRQTRQFTLPYGTTPLYNLVMAVCRTPQGAEVLWVYGQDSQRTPIRMVALQLTTSGQLISAQLLSQAFQGQRLTPPASCDPDTGALMLGILNGRELGHVAVNGTSWLTPFPLPPVETNNRPSTPGDALYSGQQLILYGPNMGSVFLYDRRTLRLTSSLYSSVAAVAGASDITALDDGSFVVSSRNGFYSVASRVDAQGLSVEKYGVYQHNVSSDTSYGRLVTADPSSGVTYVVESVIPQRGAASAWVRVFVNGQYSSSFDNDGFFSNPLFDPVGELLWTTGSAGRQGGVMFRAVNPAQGGQLVHSVRTENIPALAFFADIAVNHSRTGVELLLLTTQPVAAVYWWDIKGRLLRNSSLSNCTRPQALLYDALRDQLAVRCYTASAQYQIPVVNLYDGRLRLLAQLTTNSAGPLFSFEVAGLAVSLVDGSIVGTDSTDHCLWTWPRRTFDNSSAPSPPRARSSSGGSRGSGSSTGSPSVEPSGPSSSSSSSSQSSAALIGGVMAAVVVVLAVAAFLVWRRRQSQRVQQRSAWDGSAALLQDRSAL